MYVCVYHFVLIIIYTFVIEEIEFTDEKYLFVLNKRIENFIETLDY